MADEDNTFAQWLDASMQARGLSQAGIAKQVGVADAQVSRWRRGSVTPSVRYLQRIADTFQVPRSTLEEMAGYESSALSAHAESATIDPEREADIQALQSRLREVLERGLPRSLWSAYGDACESLAMELAASFERVLSDAQSDTARRIGFQQRNSTKTGVSKDGGLET